MVFGAVWGYNLADGQCSSNAAWEQEEETLSEALCPTIEGRGGCTSITAPALKDGMGGGAGAMSVREQDCDGVHFYFFAITSSPQPVEMLLFTLLHIMQHHQLQQLWEDSRAGQAACWNNQAVFLAHKFLVNISLIKPVWFWCFVLDVFGFASPPLSPYILKLFNRGRL